MTNVIIENKDWEALSERFDWVRDMDQVPQHKIHHAEGNVAVHTQLVIKGLSSIGGYDDLNDQEKDILWTAALLHDVEKRSTSVDYGHGIISAKGHAEKGEFTARTVLYRDLPTVLNIREQVASLVRLHGLPLWFRDSLDPDMYIRAASLRVDTRMLAILSESDAKGRICEGPKELMEAIQAFKKRCKELDCWGKAAPFVNNDERFNYFHPELSLSAKSDNKSDEQATVFILVSLPYADRENYINKYLPHLPVVNISGNLFTVDSSQLDKMEKEAMVYLNKRQSFVWNGCNLIQTLRAPLINYLALKGYKINIIYIEQPYETWIERAKQINKDLTSTDIDMYLSHLEIPQLTEAHEVSSVYAK